MKIRTVDNLERYLVGKKTKLSHQLLAAEMKEMFVKSQSQVSHLCK